MSLQTTSRREDVLTRSQFRGRPLAGKRKSASLTFSKHIADEMRDCAGYTHMIRMLLSDQMRMLQGRAVVFANLQTKLYHYSTPVRPQYTRHLACHASQINNGTEEASATLSASKAAALAKEEETGIRFVFERPRTFVMKAVRQRRNSSPTTVKVSIDESVEGQPSAFRARYVCLRLYLTAQMHLIFVLSSRVLLVTQRYPLSGC